MALTSTEFVHWYNTEFKQSILFETMTDTTEGSPWHREQNVGIHTDMVVTEYLIRCNGSWDIDALKGALACAFHDVGKPAAHVVKFKPERGNYNAFHGHEQFSARMWEDWAVANFQVLLRMGGGSFSARDIQAVTWMIEHHLPWDIAKPDKLLSLHLTPRILTTTETFMRVLMSDTAGRQSDDWDIKYAKTEEWIANFIAVDAEYDMSPGEGPVMWVLIGASGSGKSTYRKNLRTEVEELSNFSLDDVRLRLYSPEDHDMDEAALYRHAYEKSCDDKQFRQKANAEFSALVKNKNHIVIDNTNTTVKGRRFYVDQAKRAGYFCIGVVFPVTTRQVVLRQLTRPDKSVPADAVLRQYSNIQSPSIGEFHDIHVVSDNIRDNTDK